MLLEHEGRRPRVDPSAYIAPTAVLSGDVRVGAECRILFGAVLTDEGGSVDVGASTVVMEHAVLRGTRQDPLRVGAHVLVGPHASLSGATIEDECFLATGVSVFNGAHLRAGCEVRINGVVHLRTVLEPGTVVPIGWVAVGDPALIAPSDRHEEIWRVQKPLDFPGYVFGLPRQGAGDAESHMPEITRRFGRLLGRHADDRVVDGEPE